MEKPLRVLIVEDSEDDLLLLLRELLRGGFEPDYQRVDQAAEMIAALQQREWDVVIADMILPCFSGIEALRLTREKGFDLPFILVSGQMGEEWAVEAMKAGAQDYLRKGNLVRLIPAINREIKETALRREQIARRQRAEQKVQQYQQQLRALAAELSLLEEQERRRIATDLHDYIGQSLALAKIKLGALRERAATCQLTEDVEEIRGLVEEAIGYTRSLTFELSPPLLYELNLQAALEWLCEQFQNRWGISCQYQDDSQNPPVNQEICVILYKVTRELLLNIVKHAQASRAEVVMSTAKDTLRIIVRDDGSGFDNAESDFKPGGSFGLFSIHERLGYLGGHMIIQSELGQGTCITLEAPLATHDHNHKPTIKP